VSSATPGRIELAATWAISERKQEPSVLSAAPVEASTDEVLLKRIQGGDPQALDILFGRYCRLVFSIALKIVRGEDEAQEVLQEVFLYIHRKSQLFDQAKGSARSWLVQVAYHRAFDRRGYLDERPFHRADSLENHVGRLQVADDLEQQTELARLGSVLGVAFAELTEKQRTTLDLYFFHGYTLREISEKLGEPLANIRHHYYRALERLRGSLQVKALRNRLR
jgi:RNA polymerase sigma-70 factor (ECF subfamily)